LFAEGIEVLVMTSGNISDEPLICKNEKALERLGGVADAFLMHDREIYRQVDDSIVHFVDGEPALLRRARGHVPTPILTAEPCEQEIFAAGSDLKNTFCFVKQNQLICSEHIRTSLFAVSISVTSKTRRFIIITLIRLSICGSFSRSSRR
ncbi:MAG: Sua5/YciO/YrdC/YwlC family protein, partial [Planctomycetota bacterium]